MSYNLQLLEDSIAQAPAEIEREKQRGLQRFGRLFEVGDLTAVLALQQITIQLQGSLLERISHVDDGEADPKAIALAADMGRDSAIATLIALRQRLSQAQLERTVSDISAPSIPSSPAPIPHNNVYTRETTISPVNTRMEIPPFNREVEDDLFEIRSTTSSSQDAMSRHDSAAPSIHLRAQSYGSDAPAPLRIATSRTLSGTISRHSTSSNSNTTGIVAHPNRANGYLGLCKAAWKLMNGDDKALVKSKDFSQSAQSKYHFLSCSRFRCEFKGHGTDVLTNKVVKDLSRGIAYRWSFLAKSHVTMKSSKDGQYSYLCLFCVFRGASPPVMNITALLNHIGHEHCGQNLSDVILDRTHCVNDRICKDSEPFDINLFPVMNSERRSSFDMPALLSDDLNDMKLRSHEKVFELCGGEV